MPEKKHRATAPPVRIRARISDILVARSRTAEPYLHLFSVSPENVTQEHLGRLMGVFSVSDRSDSSAYIGNVIASVAKKEYFANTRREAVEGFEASLHRSNLALSEIVKNGDTRFMGHLHGILAAIEGDQIHFSITGEAAILLFRDGTLMDIGEGLASEEAATHPLKTFVEISSGQLLPGDCLLLVSPELFTLFSPKELAQNARRLVPKNGFVRFLETAMVNELKTAAALVIMITEEQTPATSSPKRKRKKEAKKKEVNFFSEQTFREAATKQAEHFLKQDPEPEDVEREQESDPKAEQEEGDAIHIEGDASPRKEEHPLITAIHWKTEDMTVRLRRSVIDAGRWMQEHFRNTSRSIVLATSGHTREIHRHLRSAMKRKIRTIRSLIFSHPAKEKRLGKKDATREIVSPDTNPILKRAIEMTGARKTISRTTAKQEPVQSSGTKDTKRKPGKTIMKIRERTERNWRTIQQNATSSARTASATVRSAFKNSRQYLVKHISRLPVKWRLIGLALFGFAATLAILGMRDHFSPSVTPEEPPVVIVEEPEPIFPPESERDASLVDIRPIASKPENIIAPIFLDERLFIVTETGIFEGDSESLVPTPSESPIIFAAGMDDLALLFLLTEKGELLSYAPANGTFSENNIDFPDGFRPAGIGTFLTYLYLLDEASGNIYRYPRIEGGFGERTKWTVDPIDMDPASIAINGSVYIASDSEVISLFQGKPSEDFTLESPEIPLTATTLCAHEELPERFVVLDTATKRVLLYDTNGSIIRQYFNESFSSMTSCSLNESGTEVSVSSPHSIYVFSLKE